MKKKKLYHFSPRTGKTEECTGNCLYGNSTIHGNSREEVEQKVEAQLVAQYGGSLRSGRKKKKKKADTGLERARRQYGNNVVPFDIEFSDDVNRLLSTLRSHGFKPLLAGGAVRDAVLNQESSEDDSAVDFKDLDFEVYADSENIDDKDDTENVTQKLVRSASEVGDVDEVGKSFGVLKMTLSDKTEIDLSLPRRESKSGSGHTGFDVEPDITMSTEEASARRDFTLNSMLYDDENKVIIDPHQGLDDLKNKRLRHTSAAFAEDPLRVLRSFQFASRFGFDVDKNTIAFSQQLFSEYDTISKERVQTEWDKWASKGVKPSSGLKVLSENGWDEGFAGLKNANTKQTQEAVDNAARLVNADQDQDQKLDSRVLIPSAVVVHIVDDDKTKQESLRKSFVESTVIGVRNQRRILALANSSDGGSYNSPAVADIVTTADAKHAALDTRSTLRERLALHKALSGSDAADTTNADIDHIENVVNTAGVMDEAEKDVINGNDVLEMSDRKPGKWMSMLMKDLRLAQAQEKFSTKAEGLEYAKGLLSSADIN